MSERLVPHFGERTFRHGRSPPWWTRHERGVSKVGSFTGAGDRRAQLETQFREFL